VTSRFFWVVLIGFAAACGSSSGTDSNGGSGGAAGSAGTAGSDAGTAGTGGSAGNDAGTGGSAGNDAGLADAGGSDASAGAGGAAGSSGAAGNAGSAGSDGGIAGAGGSAGAAGAGGISGAGGSPTDTCPVPTGAFQFDGPPGPGSNTTRHRTVLQVPSSGPASVFTSQLFQNGSFYSADLERLDHDGAKSWSAHGVANGGIGLSIARSLSTTHGADPCVAYTYDYDGTLHLQCKSLSDRTIAPKAGNGVAIAASGGVQQVIYGEGGTLHWVEVNSTAGTPETIDSAWELGSTSMVLDSSGVPHVAYVTLESNKTRTVHYATRTSNGWKTEKVANDTWGSSSDTGDTVSIVLDAGKPLIAYYLRATKSLQLARRTSSGFSSVTLSKPPSGYPNDSVGHSVALSIDCMGRLHAVFQRSFTTDPTPNLRLYYADIENDKLVSPKMLPLTASTAFTFYGGTQGLSFYVAPDGKQYVAAELGGVYGSGIYFASR
jgi:hypothetical protein